LSINEQPANNLALNQEVKRKNNRDIMSHSQGIGIEEIR